MFGSSPPSSPMGGFTFGAAAAPTPAAGFTFGSGLGLGLGIHFFVYTTALSTHMHTLVPWVDLPLAPLPPTHTPAAGITVGSGLGLGPDIIYHITQHMHTLLLLIALFSSNRLYMFFTTQLLPLLPHPHPRRPHPSPPRHRINGSARAVRR